MELLMRALFEAARDRFRKELRSTGVHIRCQYSSKHHDGCIHIQKPVINDTLLFRIFIFDDITPYIMIKYPNFGIYSLRPTDPHILTNMFEPVQFDKIIKHINRLGRRLNP